MGFFFDQAFKGIAQKYYFATLYGNISVYTSDHVHRFYGAVSPRSMRPDATFQDLREADGDTGNVEENKSLYWNPVIYKVITIIYPVTSKIKFKGGQS